MVPHGYRLQHNITARKDETMSNRVTGLPYEHVLIGVIHLSTTGQIGTNSLAVHLPVAKYHVNVVSVDI